MEVEVRLGWERWMLCEEEQKDVEIKGETPWGLVHFEMMKF